VGLTALSVCVHVDERKTPHDSRAIARNIMFDRHCVAGSSQ
jgi:hypothetical protein